jgi:hypothetical protein
MVFTFCVHTFVLPSEIFLSPKLLEKGRTAGFQFQEGARNFIFVIAIRIAIRQI